MFTQENNFVVGFDLDGVIIDHTQNKMRIAARTELHSLLHKHTLKL